MKKSEMYKITAFNLADGKCVFCRCDGLEDSGYYFKVVKDLGNSWYENKFGWITDGEIQICDKCKSMSIIDLLERINENKILVVNDIFKKIGNICSLLEKLNKRSETKGDRE